MQKRTVLSPTTAGAADVSGVIDVDQRGKRICQTAQNTQAQHGGKRPQLAHRQRHVGLEGLQKADNLLNVKLIAGIVDDFVG